MVSICLPQLQHVVLSQLILSCSFAQPRWASFSQPTRAFWTRAQNVPLVWAVLARSIVSSFIVISDFLRHFVESWSLLRDPFFLSYITAFLYSIILRLALIAVWNHISPLLFFYLCLQQDEFLGLEFCVWQVGTLPQNCPGHLFYSPVSCFWKSQNS